MKDWRIIKALYHLGVIDKTRPLAASLKMGLFTQQQVLVLGTPNTALCPGEGEFLQRTLVKFKHFIFC